MAAGDEQSCKLRKALRATIIIMHEQSGPQYMKARCKETIRAWAVSVALRRGRWALESAVGALSVSDLALRP